MTLLEEIPYGEWSLLSRSIVCHLPLFSVKIEREHVRSTRAWWGRVGQWGVPEGGEADSPLGKEPNIGLWVWDHNLS